MNSSKRINRALRALAFASVSLAALPAAAGSKGTVTVLPPAATPTGGAVQAMNGTLSPFNGTLSPFGGTLSPFYGTLSPFYGTLSPFYGTLSPFYGTLSPFNGTLSPFNGTLSPFNGTLSPFNGTLSPFWGDITQFTGPKSLTSGVVTPDFANMGGFWNGVSTQWGAIAPAWTAAKTSADYSSVAGQLQTLVSNAATFWGPAVQARTGKSFSDGFATPFMTKFGIDLTNPASLSAVSDAQRQRFLLAWFDGLMEFAGIDHVDHWMSEVNWSPALTQVQGSGSNTVIGLLDFTVKNAADIQDNITLSGGVSTFSNGHGAAVASLMVAAHDGQGVMGIAPRASVVTYNPFDSSGTANWSDIKTGLIMLGNNNASIINASLGVSGYALHPDFNGVLKDSAVRNALKSAVVVVAAGNSGAVQPVNVEWDKNNAQFFVVGSVDPTLKISTFSNTPGSACLVVNGKCGGDYLMNHFIVASGENILVSDDAGGVTRMTGTSFAAPLVSGAIALLHDRWPWLADHPKDTVNIIVKSAKDLGAPGVDPVYGVGLLDVQASQSPLSYNALSWWAPKSGVTAVKQLSDLQMVSTATLRDSKQQASWEANGVYVYGFEQLSETFRDFAIPLSSKLVGQSVMGAQGQSEQLQNYLTNSFTAWAGAAPAATTTSGKSKFMNFNSRPTTDLAVGGGYSVSFAASPRTQEAGWRQSGVAFAGETTIAKAGSATGLKFGYGEGAASLSGVTGFGLHTDYDPQHGGVNPLLGFASGGAYGAADVEIAPRLKLTGGATIRQARRDLTDLSGADRLSALAVGDYKAEAARVGLTWRASNRLQLSSGMTRLNEDRALLGVQSTDPSDLGHGSASMGLDVGFDFDAGHGFKLSGAATRGQVSQQGAQNLTTTDGGLSTSSFEVAVAKTGLFGRRDRVRFSLSQPLYVERGQLSYSGLQVVDRQTGELGMVTQSFEAAAGERPYVAEVLYATPFANGAGELGLVGRAENRAIALDGSTTAAFTAGAKMKLRY